ncbi:MAG: hypothetical protein HY293_00325 [Planctomycetes bacterium]|nr:hypothetical protein [Planctomycetota bacterium]
MTLLLGTLYVLAVVDATVSGYSAAAGRSALIRKGPHYLKSMARGFVLGQIAAALSLSLVLLALRAAPDPSAFRADLARVWVRMLQVYLPYAGLIFSALAFRLIPSVDIRCLTSTLVFGPLAGIRPLVGVAGLIWGVLAAPRFEIVAGGAGILALWLSLEGILGAFQRPKEAL